MSRSPIGAIEALKDVRQILGRNPTAGILDDQLHLIGVGGAQDDRTSGEDV